MQLADLLFLSLAAITTGADALQFKPNVKFQPVTKNCYTSYGHQKLRQIPTSTHYNTLTATKTKTIWTQPTVTVTPAPVTQKITTTITTTTTTEGSATTDIATITSTVTTTSTEVVPSTTTSTDTRTSTVSTTTTSTSTVSAPTGFLPIQTTLPGSFFQKRELDYIAQIKTRDILKRGKAEELCGISKGSHPAKVKCEVYSTKTITKTTTKTQTPCTKTAKPSTVTSTITTTSTKTSTTFPPNVTSTSTVTTTSTTVISTTPIVTATTTTTTTTTTTIAAETTPTAYAQCAANNFASEGPSPGQYFLFFASNSGEDFASARRVEDVDEYGCCVACALEPDCGLYFYTSVLNTCSLLLSSTCAAQADSTWSILNAAKRKTNTWGNGACARITSYVPF